LCEFKLKVGHCLVPQSYSPNPELGRWVRKQRHHYRLHQEGNPSHLTEERIRELERDGFVWEPNAAVWSIRLRQLCEFTAQFGHCLVPHRSSTNPELGQWVSNQRYSYRLYQKRKSSPITAERIRELVSVGFAWEPNAAIWNVRLRHMCEFKAQFGHCLVPDRISTNPKLGEWVTAQRHHYRLYQEGNPSNLTKEHIRELECVEFVWEPNAVSWSERQSTVKMGKINSQSSCHFTLRAPC
jgi:hypothetical protein